MKRLIYLFASTLFVFTESIALVPKKMTVEHYTNTLCSVCASRNPGFKSNLNNEGNFTLLTVHPSSPYSTCQLNQFDKRSNDGRTKYNGVFGSTPRLVINGKVISASANYSNTSLFDPYRSDSTSFEIKINQFKISNTLIRFKVVVKAVDTNSLKTGHLYFAVAERQLQYNAPNGETSHQNVLRKSLTDSSGNIIQLPTNVGDSVVQFFEWMITGGLSNSELIGVAILHKNNKEVMQSETSKPSDQDPSLSLNSTILNHSMFIYPNPSNNWIQVSNSNTLKINTYQIYDIGARLVLEAKFEEKIDVLELDKGWYHLHLKTNDGTVVLKFLKN
jgi:hypothetical protein